MANTEQDRNVPRGTGTEKHREGDLGKPGTGFQPGSDKEREGSRRPDQGTGTGTGAGRGGNLPGNP